MSETKKIMIEAITTEGTFMTDPHDVTPEQLDDVRQLVSTIGDLDSLVLKVDGQSVYLNPKYVVAITLIEED